jgi:hypothetical protein
MRTKLRLTPSHLLFCLIAVCIVAALVIAPTQNINALPGANMALVSITRAPNSTSYLQGSTFEIVIATQNAGSADADDNTATIGINLASGVEYTGAAFNSVGGQFACAPVSTATVSCFNPAAIPADATDEIRFTVSAVTPGSGLTNMAQLIVAVDDNQTADDGPISDSAFSIVTPAPDLSIAVSHQGAPSGSPNFQPGSNTGSVTVTVTNVGGTPIGGFTTVIIFLNGDLSLISSTLSSTPNGIFTGACAGTDTVTCVTTAVFAARQSETITFNVQAPATDPDTLLYLNSATVLDLTLSDVNLGNNSAQDPVVFDIAGPPTPTPVPSLTPIPTLGIPTPTVPPPPTATFTPTLIPPIPTRTPLPRPANAGQAIPIPPSGVNVVVDRDGVNVRLLPAIGAEVVGFVNAGTTFNNVEARSPDNEWVRVNFAGQQAWIGTAVITVLNGDIGALPVADPRTIPYGGFENPRAGLTSLTGTFIGRLELSGLRLRAGPSQGYPVLANAPRYAELRLLGRTADNVWLQVNWEGTLGWVAAQFVALPEPGLALFDTLPIDGIVADALPISEPTQDSYTDTLRLLRDRLELAQPSLDEIRARWTTIALGERAQCGDYPARPSDYNIPNTVLAPFYATLNPLMTDFNLAMAHLRQAIDLLIESCQFAQPPEGLVGEGGAAVALQAVNDADALFSSLRARLNELIPVDAVPTEEQCLFTFQNQSEIVPRLRPSVVQFARLSQRNFVTGFCFDATVGASYRIEIVKASGNILPQASVSSFNNPTNFLGVGRIGQGETYTAVTPILIPETGQYIVIVSDLTDTERSGPMEGEFAILLTDITGRSGVLAPGIAFDPNSGQVIVNPSPFNPIVPTAAVSTPGGGVSPSTCPNVTFTCSQLLTCAEAQACLAAGNLSLDPDGDRIACEENLCIQTGPTLTFTPVPTAPS